MTIYASKELHPESEVWKGQVSRKTLRGSGMIGSKVRSKWVSWSKLEVFSVLGRPGVKRDAEDMSLAQKRSRSGRNDLYCDICDVWANSTYAQELMNLTNMILIINLVFRGVMDAHLTGKEHLRRVKPLREHFCSICNVTVSSEETLRNHQKVILLLCSGNFKVSSKIIILGN